MIEVINFPNLGFLKVSLSDAQVDPIRKEIQKIEKNFQSAVTANSFLVGNIQKEYRIIENQKYLEDLLKDYVLEYENNFKYLRHCDLLSDDRPLTLNHAWVNFQEKHEFNPTHDHSGLFSFVIWIKIPYSISNERKYSPGSQSRSPVSGHFCFYYTNSLGKICQYDIPADQEFENTLLLFPAKMQHGVYPFYTSNEYRISVSGNILFRV
jgi:hypothetical protein